ncbi:MAG TPA: VOC family protein [Spirochaetia bacterium]|nr:VOC family protein [Spirochaetia bacterium]
MSDLIHGVQQIGIGVADADASFTWLRNAFGIDVPVFDDVGEPVHMLRYTGNSLQKRRAILAASIRGGSAFEIWQYTSRAPEPPSFAIELGDTGILAARIKTADPQGASKRLAESGVEMLGGLSQDPAGVAGFFVRDPWNNLFQIVESDEWFTPERGPAARRISSGGACGCLIGVSDMERALAFYRDMLGYDTVRYDATGVFHDLAALPGGTRRVRRVRVERSVPPSGPFGRWIGSSSLELLQAYEHTARGALQNRFWGDLGFIHLCFDIHGMDELKSRCRNGGFPFTVDSAESFDMGEASGRFAYVEDPDGTLIEFVHAERIPILKKLGIYLNLGKRDPAKPLPDWMIRLLGLGRVRS